MNKITKINKIIRIVARYYGYKPAVVNRKTRKHEIILVRQVSMYFASKYKLASLKEIGFITGRKNHATVLHSKRQIEDLIFSDKQIRNDITYLEPGIEKLCANWVRKEKIEKSLSEQLLEICSYSNPINMRIALNNLRVNQLS